MILHAEMWGEKGPQWIWQWVHCQTFIKSNYGSTPHTQMHFSIHQYVELYNCTEQSAYTSPKIQIFNPLWHIFLKNTKLFSKKISIVGLFLK